MTYHCPESILLEILGAKSSNKTWHLTKFLDEIIRSGSKVS